MNDWDREVIGAAGRDDLLSIRDAANKSAAAVERLAGAFEQRNRDADEWRRQVRADIGDLHRRINLIPQTIDAKVIAAMTAHVEACAEDTGPIVQRFKDREAVHRYAARQMRWALIVIVVAATAALGLLLAAGKQEAAAIVGTVFGVATPFALLILNRK